MIKTTRTSFRLSFAVAGLLGALLVGCAPSEPPAGGSGGPGGPGGPGGRPGGGPGGPGGASLSASASPAEIYQAKCQGCHGADGQGGSGPSLASAAAKSAGDLRQVIHDGRQKMPTFKDQLSEAQIDTVTAHVKQLASAK